MTFSILDLDGGEPRRNGGPPPEFFVDLNLDQIVAELVKGREQYDLEPFLFQPLHDPAAVRYRQDVFRDLESAQLYDAARAFSAQIADMRAHLAQAAKIRNRHEANAWFLEAADMYRDAVVRLERDLSASTTASRGLTGLREYVRRYVASAAFADLVSDSRGVHARLAGVEYVIVVRDGGFTVRRYDGEPNYSDEVEAAFEKFKPGSTKDYRSTFKRTFPDMDHIEAQVLTFVAQLYPAEFAELAEFCSTHRNYADETLLRFEREIQFYIAYIEYVAPLKTRSLDFCYPAIATMAGDVHNRGGFDLALAKKLASRDEAVVPNDFFLRGKERVIVVSGPNQGGKTTFARAFGQIHYLAALGCPVPGKEATLHLFDRMFAQFEREERVENLRGKLEDDLWRLRTIVDSATESSVVILNEIFNSTTIADAVFLSRRIMERLLERSCVAVWVTFIDELSTFGEATVSMVSTVVPEDPAVRTFKVVRKPADGLAYALAIAEKHRVTRKALLERIPS